MDVEVQSQSNQETVSNIVEQAKALNRRSGDTPSPCSSHCVSNDSQQRQAIAAAADDDDVRRTE